MAPKKRNTENAGLPARWRLKHGAYYYRVPPGLESYWDGKKDFRLGKTLSEAHRVFSERVQVFDGQVSTMEHLFDRYLVEVIPNKAPATQRSNRISMARLRSVFGSNAVAAIRPQNAYQYRDAITRTSGATSANRDLEVL